MSGGGAFVVLLAAAGGGYALYRWGGIVQPQDQTPQIIPAAEPKKSGLEKLSASLSLAGGLADAWGINLGGLFGGSGSGNNNTGLDAGGDSLPEIINAFAGWKETTMQAIGATGNASGQYAPLLNVIGRAEGGAAGYDAISGLVARSRYPSKPVSLMTVGAVLDWQRSIDRFQNSEAVGRYQIMEDTLRSLVSSGSVSSGETFGPAVQDRCAVQLMRGRGLDRYMSGSMTAESFANALAREWAGLPVVTGVSAGRSYYDKFNGNSATVSVRDYMAAVRSIRPVYA